MAITSFEDIIAWQKARLLTKKIYAELKGCRDFGFKGQMERAAVSIMNNIAEGFERKSNKELSQYLFIAKGSCGEVRSMIVLGGDLGYFENEVVQGMKKDANEIARLLSGFIKSI